MDEENQSPQSNSSGKIDEISSIDDIRPGMLLMGTVTNTTKFGAFVNVGIKETGLVHISEIANQFVVDPADFVQIGQEVKVLVTDVDPSRGRISLSIKRVEAS
jgi:uncharacterized protein